MTNGEMDNTIEFVGSTTLIWLVEQFHVLSLGKSDKKDKVLTGSTSHEIPSLQNSLFAAPTVLRLIA